MTPPCALADRALTTNERPGPGTIAAGRHRDPELPRVPGWTSEEWISREGRADVLLVRRSAGTDRQPYAAKLLRVTADGALTAADARRRAMREVTILRAAGRVGGAGVPRVVAYGTGARDHARPWLVMPYYPRAMWRAGAAGPQWADAYRGDVDRVLAVVATLADTLAALHAASRPIVHHDVGVDAVLFPSGSAHPVLGCFGRAHLAGDAPPIPGDVDAAAPGARAAHWRPPELTGHARRPAGPASDVFMLGGLLYEALSGGRVLPPVREWGAHCVHEAPEYALTRLLADCTDDPRVAAVSALLGALLTVDADRRMPARGVGYACRGILSTSRRRLSA